MIRENIKMALASIAQAKFRSFLTMLGIVIGVGSVLIFVSLGEGVKRQISQQIDQFGSDLITIRSGKLISRDASGSIVGFNLGSAFDGGSLSHKDWELVQSVSGVAVAVPIQIISAELQVDEQRFSNALIVATTENMPQILNQGIAHGEYYKAQDQNQYQAVIGRSVAQELFQEENAVGRMFTIREQRFVVRGVFNDFPSNPLNVGASFNTAVFIPLSASQKLAGGSDQIREIYVKPQDKNQIKPLINAITDTIKNNHGGQEDFTVIRQEELLQVTNSVLTVLTTLISSIAAISLIVGGIGIMNIMFFSVSERTKEIGIRKAVGATNVQIWGQFLIESAVLSMLGGTIGVIVATFSNILIRISTNIKPVITMRTVVIAVGVSLIVGILFGVLPALKAASKDPIESLRHD